jgi:hypothetical protein
LGVGLMGLERTANSGGEFVQHHLTDIVPVMTVAGPGVPEPDYKPGVAIH